MSSIRIKAKERNGSVDVKTLMKHNMETGLRKGKDGKKFQSTGSLTLPLSRAERSCLLRPLTRRSPKDPYLAFKFAGKKGDTVKISWKDSQGKTDSAETKVK